jgi:AcrR family transcriptional regulator
MGRPKLIADGQLLAAARSVFVRDGVGGSTREIAGHAGISESALFKRFPTKAALFLAAMVPPKIAAGAIVAEAEAATNPHQALRILSESLLTYFRQLIPVMLPLVQNPLIGPETVRHLFGERALAVVVNDVTAYLARQQRARRIARAADPAATAALLIAVTHSIAQFDVIGLHAAPLPGTALQAIVDSLWNGLAPDGGPTPKRRP